jgi:hypothetical protein
MDLTSRPEVKEVFTKLVKHCEDLFDLYSKSEYRTSKIDESGDSRSAYEQKPVKRSFPWENASSVTLPLTTITVDNLEPRIVAGLVGRDPYLMFEMTGKKGDDVKMLEDWFNGELKNRVKLENKTMSIVHDLLLDGTVFPIVEYVSNEETVREYVVDPATGQNAMSQDGTLATTDRVKSNGEGGALNLANFDHIYMPDNIGTAEEWEAADVIRLIYPTYSELITQASRVDSAKSGYINIGPWLLQERDQAKMLLENATAAQEIDGINVTGKEVIECMECHVSYPIYQDVTLQENEQTNWNEEKIIFTIAKKSGVPIRFMLQRSLNFENRKIIKRIRLYPENGKSYGTAIYGKIKSLQNGSSDLFNSIQDTLDVTLVPYFFYTDKTGLKGQIKIEIGKGIKVDSVEGIKFPTFNINADHYMPFFNVFLSLWERTGSIGDLQIGRPSDLAGKNKTATEIMAVIEEGNIKHNYQAKVTREEFIEVLRTIYDLYYQNMPANKTFEYQGQQVSVPRQIMKRDYKYVLNGSTEMANKLIDRKEKEGIFQLLGGDPFINPIKVREDLLKSYKIPDAAEYINPQQVAVSKALIANPEITQVIQKYLQTKAQTAQAIKGGVNAGPVAQ